MASGSARRALGRGLTNLIPQDSEEKGSDNEVVLVDSEKKGGWIRNNIWGTQISSVKTPWQQQNSLYYKT
jgi:hypothetical protein